MPSIVPARDVAATSGPWSPTIGDDRAHDDAVADGEMDPRDLSRGEVLTLLVAVPVAVAGFFWATSIDHDDRERWPVLMCFGAVLVAVGALHRWSTRRSRLSGMPQGASRREPLELVLNGLGMVVFLGTSAFAAKIGSTAWALAPLGLAIVTLASILQLRRTHYRPILVPFVVGILLVLFSSVATFMVATAPGLSWLRIFAVLFLVVVLVVAVVVGQKIVRDQRNAAGHRHRPPQPRFL